MLNLEKIGNKISMLRKQNNMKQSDLADALYVTHQAVSKWEKGKSIPSIEILYDLTQLFQVSIDFLLDDSDILNDDYETLFKCIPREAVIRKALENDNLNHELTKLFYLLSKAERLLIINKIINNQVKVDIDNIWHILSLDEREYILVIILKNKFNFDLNKIYNYLSVQEKNLIKSHVDNGTFCYIIPQNRKGVIL